MEQRRAVTRETPRAIEKKLLGLRTNALGFPALFAQSLAADLTDHDGGADHPAGLRQCGTGHVAGLRLRHSDAALRRVLPQPVRQAVGLRRLHVRLHGRGPRPDAPASSRAGRSSGRYFFIAVAGLCGFAVFCGQLLSALGYHGSVHPIIFFAISAVACWVIAYKDIRVSSILTLVLEGASVACILALAFIVLFKHGFSVDTKQLSLEGVNVRRHGPGRRRLHLLPCRLRERHGARRLRRRTREERAEGGDRQPAHHRCVHGLHGLRRGGGHPPLRHAAGPSPLRSTSLAALRSELVQDPALDRRDGELLLPLAVVPERRLSHHLPDGPARDLLGAPRAGPRHEPHAARRGHASTSR